MTNGTLTRRILKDAKTLTGDTLFSAVKRHMSQFPLSSYKLVYPSDKPKVSPEAWEVIIRAAIETDRQKLAEVNSLRKECGLKPDTEFGRYQV
jgi:hypothetical protein